MPETIFTATTSSDYDAFAELVRQYVGWLHTRYQHDAWFMEGVLNHQSLDSELQALAASYGPPDGKTLLARRDGEICGGGALRRLSEGICEMKRLYVPDRFRGQGTGRRLAEALIATAQADGFRLMRLDTGSLLKEAIAMYRSIGFRPCPPYHDYPPDLMPHLVFMELPLA